MSSAPLNAAGVRGWSLLFLVISSVCATNCVSSARENLREQQGPRERPLGTFGLGVMLPDGRDLTFRAVESPETHDTFGAGTIHRVRELSGGLKDDIEFPMKPAKERVSYKVELGGRDGLVAVRQLDQRPIIEWLGRDGAVRFRTLVPGLFDKQKGKPSEGQTPDWRARVEIEGCEIDRDPRPAVHRDFVRAGASRCVLTVDWTGVGVTYPAVLDPVWTTASDMLAPRQSHRAIKLQDGNVLVVGGEYAGVTTEIFDVATRTWSLTGDLTTARFEHVAALLDDGRVLVAGGQGVTMLASCELYDPTTGTWSMTGNLGVARRGAALTYVPGGDAVITGGNTSGVAPAATVERYSAQNGTWSSISNLLYARRNHAAVVRNGKLIVAGGERSSSVVTSTVEELDPTTGSWALFAPLIQKRAFMGYAVRRDGTVVIAGGDTGVASSPYMTSTEVLSPKSSAWQSGPTLSVGRRGLILIELEGGDSRDRLLAIGGVDGGTISTAVDGWLRDESQWDPLPDMMYRRYLHDATALEGGGALVTGGTSSGSTAEVFFSESQGASCTHDAECSTGYCTDGVCCEARCSDSCARCDSAGKSGSCVAIEANAAAAFGHAACIATTLTCAGRCDGSSTACVYPGADTPCGSVSCDTSAAIFPACKGDGSCGAPVTEVSLNR